MKNDLLNSPTDGNTFGIEDMMRAKYRGSYNLRPSQSLSGPDGDSYGKTGMQNGGYSNNASMQQNRTMHNMPPNPNPGRASGRPMPKPMQFQNRQEDCNCK